MNKVGIVFPVLNCLDRTKDAFATIRLPQDSFVILVDNGSNDGTQEWAKSLAPHVPITVIENEKNPGLAIAWNQGVQKAIEFGCEYILVTNNDVLFHPETVNNLVKALDTHPEWGMATAVNEKSKYQSNPWAIVTAEIPSEPTSAESPDFSCFMLRASTYATVGPFDEEFAKRGRGCFEDNDYHYRMKKLGIPAQCTTSAPYYHYGSETINRERDNLNGFDFEANRAYYIEKHGGMPGQETR